MMEDTHVLALVRDGDSAAFTEIMVNYHEPIKRYLYHLTGDYEAARDLTQDTFLRAYSAIMKNDAAISLKPWLYRIATNAAYSYNEKRKLISFIPFGSRLEKHNGSTGYQPAVSDENLAVQEALRKLPRDYRLCLTLHYIEGFKYREIAETLQVSEESVRKRAARGKDLFIKIYKRG